jgi:hypothetical protein
MDLLDDEIMQAIEPLYPHAIKPQLFSLQAGIQKHGGDLSTMIGNRNFEELSPSPHFKNLCKPAKHPKNAPETDTFTVTCQGPILSALIFRDSFFNILKPYFSRQFRQTTYTWGKLDFSTLKDLLEKHKPDIVIEEIVERKMPYIPAPIPELQMNHKGQSSVAEAYSPRQLQLASEKNGNHQTQKAQTHFAKRTVPNTKPQKPGSEGNSL